MRGFAQTVHCPRCGTPKPTGAEHEPLLTCASCGLRFDPKPRAPRLETATDQALVPAPQALVHEEVTNVDAELWVRESVFGGLWRALAGVLIGVVASLAARGNELAPMVMLGAAAVIALYGGLGRIVNRTIVYVDGTTLTARQRPLPRHRERFVFGPVASLAVEPYPHAPGYHVVAVGADGRRQRLAYVEHAEVGTELVRAITLHRARLGAPVRSRSDED